MPAGTITLTTGSTAVTGSGTSFATELKVNDFVVAVVGGVTYTLGVQAIGSATSLTLTTAYNGPTTSGLAWTALPNAALVGITAQVAADVAKAIRGFNFDKVNWQKIFSNTASVTVTMPDLTQFTGPSWGYMSTQFGNMLTKADNLGSLADKAAARTNLGLGDLATLNGPLAINKGGTGSATPFGTAANSFAQGNDSRLNTIDGKSGGTLTSWISSAAFRATGSSSVSTQGVAMGWNDYNDGGAVFQNNRGGGNGGYRFRVVNAANSAEITLFNLSYTGIGYAPGGWTTGSDERIKEDIQDIDPDVALQAVLNLRHVTFKMRDRPDGEGGWVEGERSVGYLAQDLEKYLPDAVMTQKQSTEFAYRCRGDNDDIVVVKDLKSIDPGKAAAALNGSAIKALNAIIEKQNNIITELQNRMKSIDGLDA